MKEIKKEVVDNVLYHKDVFTEHGILLEDFDFEMGNYEKLIKEPLFTSEALVFNLRIPFKYISKGVFEFSLFLDLGFEPRVKYHLYDNNFLFVKRPEISLELSFSESFIEEHFKGSYNAFSEYARPILREYFKEEEVDLFLSVVGGVAIEIYPYIKYKEIII